MCFVSRGSPVFKSTGPSGFGPSHSQVKLHFRLTSTEELVGFFLFLLESKTAGNVAKYKIMC